MDKSNKIFIYGFWIALVIAVIIFTIYQLLR